MSTESRWRRRAREVIQEVIKRVGRSDEKALRKAISDAYPFGARANHPYTVWLSEVKFQIEWKPSSENVPGVEKLVPLPGQMDLFGE